MFRKMIRDEEWAKIAHFFPDRRGLRGRPRKKDSRLYPWRYFLDSTNWSTMAWFTSRVRCVGNYIYELPSLDKLWSLEENNVCFKEKDHQRQMWSSSYWCDNRTSAPACSWCKWGQKNQALGRSRGGFSTKVHFAVSKEGYPLRFRITAGQSADIHEIIPLLAQRTPAIVIADTAYDSNRVRAVISGWGSQIVIPNHPQRNKPFPLDKEMYKKRCAVEIFINKMKQYRRLATRYDKTQKFYAAMVAIGCIRIALRFWKHCLVYYFLARA